jgi:hypothetical protein
MADAKQSSLDLTAVHVYEPHLHEKGYLVFDLLVQGEVSLHLTKELVFAHLEDRAVELQSGCSLLLGFVLALRGWYLLNRVLFALNELHDSFHLTQQESVLVVETTDKDEGLL